jgi:hypothetical protein
LPDEFRAGELKEAIDRVRADARLRDTPSGLRRKIIQLDFLVRLILRSTGFYEADPLKSVFARSLEILSQFGIFEKRICDIDSPEGQELRRKHALNKMPAPSAAVN